MIANLKSKFEGTGRSLYYQQRESFAKESRKTSYSLQDKVKELQSRFQQDKPGPTKKNPLQLEQTSVSVSQIIAIFERLARENGVKTSSPMFWMDLIRRRVDDAREQAIQQDAHFDVNEQVETVIQDILREEEAKEPVPETRKDVPETQITRNVSDSRPGSLFTVEPGVVELKLPKVLTPRKKKAHDCDMIGNTLRFNSSLRCQIFPCKRSQGPRN